VWTPATTQQSISAGGNNMSAQHQMHLQFIPTDVLEHHILSLLSFSELISCLLVCHHLRMICSRMLAKNQEVLARKETVPAFRERSKLVLLELFEHGASLKVLQWFEKCLRYPLVFSASASAAESSSSPPPSALYVECVSRATTGIFNYEAFFCFVCC
jgi:hypothetical protein